VNASGLAVLLAVAAVHLNGQTLTLPRYIPVSVPVRDGKMLAADLYSIDTTVAKPVVLIQTPYNKNYYRSRVGLPQAGGSPFPYDSVRYNYMTVDWRGFYGSLGASVQGYDRGLDGYDMCEWIASQRWCNGKVGTWGGSALGLIQFQTMKHRPPHLVCAVPMMKDYKNKYSDSYYGGVLRREHVESLEALGFTSVSTITAHPQKDAFWNLAEFTTDYPESVAVPVLMVSGWFDHFPDDVIRAFQDLRTRSHSAVRDAHKLILGPWLHGEMGNAQQGQLSYPNAAGEPDAAAMAFFDYYLSGIRNSYPDRPVIEYYQMGAEEWRSTTDWSAVAGRTDTLFFGLGSQKGGSLSSVRPVEGDILGVAFTYDPRSPSPAMGGSRFNPFDPTIPIGPWDQRDSVLSRTDVLSFNTEPLTAPMVIVGPVRVSLSVSSNRTDTDFSIRLCDVYPEGRSMLMTQGIRRMRFRDSYTTQQLMTPGARYRVTVELSSLALTLLPGHRLSIIVSSSDWPHFDINLNNGSPMYVAGDTLVAGNTIGTLGTGASYALIPAAVTVAVAPTPEGIPDGFRLGHNYPNPFNPSTIIPFTLAERGEVSVIVHDVLGRNVRTLVRGVMDAGEHRVEFQADGLATGVYLCQLRSGSAVAVRRMMVLR
jgi:uncharacterized protein